MHFIEKTDCKLSVNGSVSDLNTYKMKSIFLRSLDSSYFR